MYKLENFYKKFSTIWQRYNLKIKGVVFMKHPVYSSLFTMSGSQPKIINEQIAILSKRFS